jgi:putative ATP-dependent endonuclease of the OLD family
MSTFSTESGIAVTHVRVSNFRSLGNVELALGDLTVLIGANNSGKTSFLDAMFAAIGAGRRILGQDDVRLLEGEAFPPKERAILVDVRIHPIDDNGAVAAKFPEGSFWTELWGTGIVVDEKEGHEFMAFRTSLTWNAARGDYVVDRKFLKDWGTFEGWSDRPTQSRVVAAAHLEPVAFNYIDAKRDLEDDLRRPGSFWRRMTEDLGLTAEDVAKLEGALSDINEEIVSKSEVLKLLKDTLAKLQFVVSSDGGAIDITPVARKLRDLSKGVDVSFATTGAQSFPLARHGMGTRSLAALLVFRAFAAWRTSSAMKSGEKLHSTLALEEPESHLHPQAQRALFSQIKAIVGQRVVSTHSPYFAGQAQLEELRLFLKRAGDTTITQLAVEDLDEDDKRKLRDSVIESRGDILFASAVVLFEGQTEEQALPVWAETYWGASIHALGFSFVRANGTDYFPFIWLAKSLQIPWYVMADGEPQPVKNLEAALHNAKQPPTNAATNIVVLPNGNNFEKQLVAEGYIKEIEQALDEVHATKDFLGQFIEELHGKPASKGNVRDYKSAGGRERAAIDAFKKDKTRLARPLARIIAGVDDEKRRFPSFIKKLFEIIDAAHNLKKTGATP